MESKLPPLRQFSCLICRQRKVKCDRHEPCANCVKAETRCTFVAPVRGKRQKKSQNKKLKPVREGLHAKLRRYERMLEKYGETLDPPMSDIGSDGDDDAAAPELSVARKTAGYFDSTWWSPNNHVPNEPIEPVDFTDENDTSLLEWLEGRPSRTSNLRELYPDAATLSHLQHIYADQIDPMVKMLHLPSLFSTMSTALTNPGSVPKSVEAVLLCFCLATVSTMSQHQCHAVLQQDRVSVVSRYKRAAMQALTNARLLQSPDFISLQALSLYLLGVKGLYGYSTFHILCGITVRLSIRVDLHRDGAILGLPPFETEVRRRLWWHTVQLDFRASELLGIRPSFDLLTGDTKPPTNLEDEDISPGMTEFAKERNGITSLTLFRVRCDVAQFLRHLYLSSLSTHVSGFDIISSSSSTAVSIEEKDRMIGELEDMFESKYLRYCDPAESLHTFASIVLRSIICRLKVLTYNPRLYFSEKQQQMQLPEATQEIIFVNAIKLLEYAALVRNNPSFGKYMWRTSATYIWDSILHALIASRCRKPGDPKTERLWHLIGILVSSSSRYSEEEEGNTFGGRAADAVYSALSKWIPEVWDEYAAAAGSQGLNPVPPDYIAEMRAQRSMMAAQPMDTQKNDISFSADDGFFEFSDLDTFASDPNEWLQWERLLAGDDLMGSLPKI